MTASFEGLKFESELDGFELHSFATPAQPLGYLSGPVCITPNSSKGPDSCGS